MSDQFKDVPEWKKAVQGAGARTATIGKKIVRSILEQRQSLPIYRLKDELLKVGLRAIFFKLVIFDISLGLPVHTTKSYCPPVMVMLLLSCLKPPG